MGLDIVELVMKVESVFGVDIRDDDASHLETVGRLYDYVARRINPDAVSAGGGPYEGEIHLLRQYQRRGLGKRLIATAVDRLLENGLTSMVLFTESDNKPACSFYEQLGGERQLNEQGSFEGMYGWTDLRRLNADLSRLMPL